MADALTEDQINTRIQAIHTKLADMVDSPQPSYKAGEYEFKWNEYFSVLQKQLEYYEKLASNISAEETTLYRDYM